MANERAKNVFQAALEAAQEKLARALDEERTMDSRREALKSEISILRRTVTSLSELCGEPVDAAGTIGITEAVTQVITHAPTPMTTRDVMTKLEEMGFDLARHKNAAASVGAILARLAERETIRRRSTGAEDTLWFSWLSDDLSR